VAKRKELLDWYGNPIPGQETGFCFTDYRHFVRGEIESDGTKFLRIYTSSGVPCDRIALEDCYLCVKDDTGNVLYDSRCEPPPDAKLMPDYVGFAWAKQLKRYFPK
jgi:hypothetical protein